MHKSDWDYRGLVAECYDLWFGEEPFWDQAFFAERLRRNGGIALEVGCGTGRLLLPFLRDGLRVEGVDASAEMLALCRQKAAAMDATPVLYQQHMQDLDLPRCYETIFIPACSFQILARREEAFATLRHFRQHLTPRGELLLTLEVPWNDFGLDRQWRLRRSGTRPADGATILIHEAKVSNRFEQLQDIWLRYEVYQDGELVQSLCRQHQLRWYHQHEFVLMLEAVGFRTIAVQSGYGAGNAADPAADMIFSARR